MWTAQFWRDVAERAIKTAAQSAILILIGGQVIDNAQAGQINVLTINWVTVLGFAAGGAVLSILTSVGSGFIPSSTGLVTASATKIVTYDTPVVDAPVETPVDPNAPQGA